MSGTLNEELPDSSEPALPPLEAPQGPKDLPSATLHHGTTSTGSPEGTLPDIDESRWSVIKEAVEEMKKLTQALKTSSEQPCNCTPGNLSQSVPNDTSRAEKSTDSWVYIPECRIEEVSYKLIEESSRQPARTRSRLGDPKATSFGEVRELFLHLLEDEIKDDLSCHYFRLQKRPAQSSADQAYVIFTGTSNPDSDCMSMDQACQWMNANWTEIERSMGIKSHRRIFFEHHVPKDVYEESPADPADCFGNMWWIMDGRPRLRLELVRPCSSERMDMNTVASIAKFFSGPYDPRRSKSFFRRFLLTFANLSHPLATRFRLDASHPNLNFECALLQLHLHHLGPVTSAETRAESVQGLALVLERQVAKIPGIPQVATQSEEKDQSMLDVYVKERALSVSLIVFTCGTFRLVVLCDAWVPVHDVRSLDRAMSKRIGIFPCNSEKGAGLSHFLVALFLLLEAWHRSWNETLDVIDGVVSFEMSHTLNEERLNNLMFDNSSSLSLSKQYFVVLQILRLVTQWIDEDMALWDKARSSIILRRKPLLWGIVESKTRKQSLEDQLDIITQLLTSQTKQLKERVDRKIEEVKSLRDGLFNATSLREARKGMALNRAIYVFTAVTIIYTPLGFMATFWALPILNTTSEGENSQPSLSAVAATFVIIPVLTYVACVWMAWYFTSTRTWATFTTYVMKEASLVAWTRSALAGRKTAGSTGSEEAKSEEV